jgi:hypothetical protein
MIKPTSRTLAIATLIFACTLSGKSFASSYSGPGPRCPPRDPICIPGGAERRANFAAISMDMFRERMAQLGRDPLIAALRQANGTVAGNLSLLGEIAGEWTTVDGYVTYTQNFPGLGFLQILLRGYEATREGSSNRYRVDWDRRIYWLNFDGGGPGVPYLMGSLELVSNYVPEANDPFPEFNGDANVLAECTVTSPCSINVLPYVLYRDPFTDYTGYPDGAADSDFLFVANAAGDAVAVSLDLYDANGQPDGRTSLNTGDELQLSTIGYKLDEPGFVYIVGYMDFVTIETDISIERQYYVPGEDFVDPNLANLNLGARKVKFLLDGYLTGANGGTQAFGGPYALGFNWSGVPDFLFRGNMESLVPDGTSVQAAP